MPTPSIIRFTDERGEYRATIYRRHHGQPEDVITNLAALKITIDRREERPPPGNIAAQFVFLDILWYALREVPLGDLDEELHTVLYSPAELDKGEYRYLRHHEILDSDSFVDRVASFYQVEVGADGAWWIKFRQSPDPLAGPVHEVFDALQWDFSGDLTEASRRFQ